MTEKKSDGRTRPFADVLLDVDKGKLHAEASTALQELIESVMATGKAGTVQISIKVNKSKSDTPMVELSATCNVKKPAITRPASFFYVDDEHNITRQNPHQPELPLREVPSPDTDTNERALRKAE